MIWFAAVLVVAAIASLLGHDLVSLALVLVAGGIWIAWPLARSLDRRAGR